MPQALYPQPPDGAFSYRPRALVSQRPGHAAGIGAVSAEWAALEEYLTLAMVRSLLAFSDEGAYSIASTTLETIESPSTRLDVVAALLKIHSPKVDFEFFCKHPATRNSQTCRRTQQDIAKHLVCGRPLSRSRHHPARRTIRQIQRA
jgi:hypothetical protein